MCYPELKMWIDSTGLSKAYNWKTLYQLHIPSPTDLSEIPPVQSHALIPEMSEKVRQDLLFDVVRLHTISHTTLLHNFQHNLAHFLVRTLELSHQDHHHLTGVIVG